MRRQILSIMADKVRFSKLHRYIRGLTMDHLWKPNATALPMALCVSFSFDYFSEFRNDYFFCVYKLHSTQARQNVYALHVVWQTVVCNLFCVL